MVRDLHATGLTGLVAAWPHRATVDLAGWYGATRDGAMLALGLVVVCALWWATAGRDRSRGAT